MSVVRDEPGLGLPPPADAPRLSPWPRALDVLAVILAILWIHALFTPGVRFDVFAWYPVSFRSAWRNLGWLTLVVSLRHYWFRRPTLPERLWAGLVRWGGDADLRAVAGLALLSRLGILIVAIFAVAEFGTPEKVPTISSDPVANLPMRWDAGWYMNIARYGYQWNPQVTGQQNVAFFPAWPTLLDASASLLRMDLLHAGVVAAIACFMAAAWYLFLLGRSMLGRERAFAALVLLASYPFSIYYSVPYTESLYLVAAVGALYHTSKREWIAAGALGLVAGLARPNGFLVAVPIVVMLLVDEWRGGAKTARERLSGLAAAAMPVLGLLAYTAFLYDRFGEPLAWLQAHGAWGRSYDGFTTLIETRKAAFTERGVFGYVLWNPYDFTSTLVAAVALLLLVPVTRTLGLAYGAFVAVNLVPPLMMGGTMSIGRLTSTLFPLFLGLAAWLPPWACLTLAVLFAMGQAVVAVLFFTWRPWV